MVKLKAFSIEGGRGGQVKEKTHVILDGRLFRFDKDIGIKPGDLFIISMDPSSYRFAFYVFNGKRNVLYYIDEIFDLDRVSETEIDRQNRLDRIDEFLEYIKAGATNIKAALELTKI